jgi:hypothetical protein
VSSFRDFFAEFTKPLRDFGGSIAVYALLKVNNDVSQSLSIQNRMEVVILLFCGISFIEDCMVSGYSYYKIGYSEPIDAFLRIVGLLSGMIVWGGILTYTYYTIGGDVSDIVVPGFIAAAFLLFGMIARLYYSKNVM